MGLKERETTEQEQPRGRERGVPRGGGAAGLWLIPGAKKPFEPLRDLSVHEDAVNPSGLVWGT